MSGRAFVLIAVLAAACTSAEPKRTPSAKPAASGALAVAAPSASGRRTCAECRQNEVCVQERGDSQCAVLATLQDLVDPRGGSKRGANVPNIRDDAIGELVVLKGVHFAKGAVSSTQIACATAPGVADDNCCNTCGHGMHLSGMGEIPVHAPDGEAVGCGGSCCKPLVCPTWLPSEEKALDVAGRFRTTTPPRQVVAPPPGSPPEAYRLMPTIYFQLANLPR